ncbi:MAG: DUF5114 domain-containing protein [Tannerella sp.]|jgi:hypothetical protein|nr:DUF5114 domain-containing protein [Tannerella sp.]
MKTFITFKLFFPLLIFLTVITSCEKDGEKIYLSELEANELMATVNEVVLSQENANQPVLSFSWTAQTFTVSNPDMKAPNLLSTSMQVSVQQDFSSNMVESLEPNLSKVYSGSDLNTVAKNLGLAADVATPVYFRLKSSAGNNMEPVYSNVLTVNVTPFTIDMTTGFILDKDKIETGVTLYSPASNGIYTGFMGAVSWYNFFMKEGDGAIWGNDPISGTPFMLSSASDSWNCWFPEPGGCYYVNMDTKAKQWSALYVPVLDVTGDIEGSMTFDRLNVKWTYVFNASSTNSLKIKLSAAGNLYNSTTGDMASVSASLAFAQQSDGTLTLAQQAGDITVSVPAAGECTLTFDLSDPKSWKCMVTSGSDVPVVIPQYLYIPGVDDGISGSWTFDNFLTLYNEEDLAYAGVINVNSLWGYSFNIEKDNWNDKYDFAEGDAYAGTLVFQGGTNLPAPDAGLYLFDVSVKGLTYSLTGVGGEIYISGLNDVWDFTTVLSATETAGVYSGIITVNGASPWGFQIHLDTSWNHYFGGSSGSLHYRGSNITDDASLAVGTYSMTVDLIHGTYSVEE